MAHSLPRSRAAARCPRPPAARRTATPASRRRQEADGDDRHDQRLASRAARPSLTAVPMKRPAPAAPTPVTTARSRALWRQSRRRARTAPAPTRTAARTAPGTRPARRHAEPALAEHDRGVADVRAGQELAQADGLGEIGRGNPAPLLDHHAVRPRHHAAEGAPADREETEEQLGERARRAYLHSFGDYTLRYARPARLRAPQFRLAAHAQERLPIFDAHVHYSHDAWESVPVQEAIAIMRKAGLKRALISSSRRRRPAAAVTSRRPTWSSRSCAPTASRGEIGTWFRDEP